MVILRRRRAIVVALAALAVSLIGSGAAYSAPPTEQDAELALHQRKLVPAIAIYSKLIAATPKKFKLYLGRGIAYYQAGQYEKAAADFTSFSKLRPALIEGYLNRAYAYERLGQYKLALADLETVEATDPDRVDRKLRERLLAATP